MNAKALLLSAATGLAVGLSISGGLLTFYLLDDVRPTSFITPDGRLHLERAAIVRGSTYDVELDACDAPTCANPEPLLGATLQATRNASLELDPGDALDRPAGQLLRWRLIDATNGALLAQSEPEALEAAPIPAYAWWFSIPVATTLLALQAVGLAALAASPSLETARPSGPRPPISAHLAPPPTPATPWAEPVPPAFAPPVSVTSAAPGLGTRMEANIEIWDAGTKLPVAQVRAVSRRHNVAVTLAPAGDPGRFRLEAWTGDEIELRAPGYKVAQIVFTGSQQGVELVPQESAFTVRVLGGSSGSPLPGIPVEVRRHAHLVFSGTTDAAGEAQVPRLQLEDEDLVQTAVGLEGFVDGKARMKQAQTSGLLELRVHYRFEPGAAHRDREKKLAQQSQAVHEAWSLIDPDIASLVGFVTERVRAPLEDYASWGRILLSSRQRPRTWYETLLDSWEAWNKQAHQLSKNPAARAFGTVRAGGVRSLAVTTTYEPDVDAWIQGDDAWQQQYDAHLVGSLEVLKARAQALTIEAARTFLVGWLELVVQDLARETVGVSASCARRLRVEAQIELIRWVLGHPGWAARLETWR